MIQQQKNSSEALTLWESVLKNLEETQPDGRVERWLSKLRIEKMETENDPCVLHLVAPQEFVVSFVRETYLDAIKALLFRLYGRPFEVVFTVSAQPLPPMDRNAPRSTEPLFEGYLEGHRSSDAPTAIVFPTDQVMRDENNPFAGSVPKLASTQSHQSFLSSPLTFGGVYSSRSQLPEKDLAHQKNPSIDPGYSFNSFVVGSSNQFAHASAVAVSENPGFQYNPLFLYSAPGLGKTHLLYAIANQMLERNPQAKILYISAEVFMNELIEAIAGRTMSKFRSQYRDSYDAILIDDIQFIAGKEKTEEEFFHTFNALHSARKQIVVSSDRPPKEIKELQARLRTRFEWGLIADIQAPEIETRIAILKTKAERDDLYLPDDVATYLATNIKSNIRELEGILIKLQAHARLTGSEMSLDLAKMHLQSIIPEQGNSYTVEQIQLAVSKQFKLRITDFKSSSKLRSVARPRQIAMYLVRKYSALGLKDIGEAFGGRDHSTVIHACREIERMIEVDEELRKSIEAVQNQL